ncbi:hypothetical protein [Erysipelothrix piscisicarius]
MPITVQKSETATSIVHETWQNQLPLHYFGDCVGQDLFGAGRWHV